MEKTATANKESILFTSPVIHISSIQYAGTQFFLGTYQKNHMVTLDDVLNIQQIRQKAFAYNGHKPMLAMADISDLEGMTKPARDLLSSPEHNIEFKAMALISGNIFSRTIARFYTYFATSPIPIDVFSDRNSAMNWLLTLK